MDGKKKSILEKIATFLSAETEVVEAKEVKLERAKLANGTEIEFETWEAGAEVKVVSSEEGAEAVALPVGEYELEDGMILVIEEEGIIGAVKEPEAEEETPEEDLNAQLEALKAENEELKALLAEAKEELAKEDITEEPKDETELSKEEETEAVELSTEDVTKKKQEDKKAQQMLNKHKGRRRGLTRTQRVHAIINGDK